MGTNLAVRRRTDAPRAAFLRFSALLLLAADAVARGQGLDIPVIAAPPELGDFTSMEPPDAVRARFATVSGFTQRAPQDGAASLQRTDVYLAYDSSNLYAVFVAFDGEPENVRANLAPRENIDYDDRVGILIDTFNDQRTAYAFRSSPVGVQWDARWSEVSKGSSFDTSYEAVWYTDARKTAGGYVVKMTIPFRAMRFPENGEQLWRIQFERWIPRLSEEIVLARVLAVRRRTLEPGCNARRRARRLPGPQHAADPVRVRTQFRRC